MKGERRRNLASGTWTGKQSWVKAVMWGMGGEWEGGVYWGGRVYIDAGLVLLGIQKVQELRLDDRPPTPPLPPSPLLFQAMPLKWG